MFRNTLTSNDKYPVRDYVNLLSPIQMQLSFKPTKFSHFFVPFLESTSNFKHFEKKDDPHIDKLFPKLQTLKFFLRILPQEHRFRTGFGSLHVKASQLLAKSPRDRFYHVLLSFLGKLIWNMSPLVSGEILGIFVNTLTDEGINPVQGCGNVQLPIQMQLSEKQETFF